MGDTDIADPRARTFADALQQLDATGDPSDLVAQFADGATLERLDARGERTDAEAFWREYRSQFDDLSTTFTHSTVGEDSASLEWVSKGTLATGRPVEYRGVTVVEYDGEKVARMRTYYDTAQFTAPPAGTE
jgi:ketosteroid isomerase-like protein